MNYMQQAVSLAEKGRGLVSPNPLVGCVIERKGKVIATGWHKGPGSLHAEIDALQKINSKAKGANLYVNLEPCCHFGNTPPCVDAIIAAQLNSVHVAVIDPNPLVNGKGIRKLQEAGIDVYVGEEAETARILNECFFTFVIKKRPFVVAKWAMTLDGKIMTTLGSSKWITGEIARNSVHKLRQEVDAILVGANTVLKDNPRLTVRCGDDCSSFRQPLRIILDGSGKTEINSLVYQVDSKYQTLVATTDRAPKKWCQQLIAKGVKVEVFRRDSYGCVDIKHLLIWLEKRKIVSLLVEGGARVLTSFFKERLVDKVYSYIAPKIVGGSEKTSPVLDIGVSEMSNALELSFLQMQKMGSDYLSICYPNWS